MAYPKQRANLLSLQNGKCHYCECDMTIEKGHPNSITVDHKKSKSRGGGDGENLLGACASCNFLKGSLAYDVFNTLMHNNNRDRAIVRALIRNDPALSRAQNYVPPRPLPKITRAPFSLGAFHG